MFSRSCLIFSSLHRQARALNFLTRFCSAPRLSSKAVSSLQLRFGMEIPPVCYDYALSMPRDRRNIPSYFTGSPSLIRKTRNASPSIAQASPREKSCMRGKGSPSKSGTASSMQVSPQGRVRAPSILILLSSGSVKRTPGFGWGVQGVSAFG